MAASSTPDEAEDNERTVEEIQDALSSYQVTEEQQTRGQELASKKSSSGSGSVVVKPQLCGKYCSGCPHGPYAWLVDDDGWHYLGMVGSNDNGADTSGEEANTETNPHQDEDARLKVTDVPHKHNPNAVDPWALHIEEYVPNSQYGWEGEFVDVVEEDGDQYYDFSEVEDGEYVRLAGGSWSKKGHEVYEVERDGGSVSLKDTDPSAVRDELRVSQPVKDALKSLSRGERVQVTTEDGQTFDAEYGGGSNIEFGNDQNLGFRYSASDGGVVEVLDERFGVALEDELDVSSLDPVDEE